MDNEYHSNTLFLRDLLKSESFFVIFIEQEKIKTMKPERPGDEKMIKELEELVPITLLTEEQKEEATRIASEKSSLHSVVYINTILNEGLKIAKVYYDLYIEDLVYYNKYVK